MQAEADMYVYMAVSVLLYLSTTSYETHHPSVIDSLMTFQEEVQEEL